MTSIDEEDALDDKAEYLEEERSESGSSDNDERDDNLDKLEEFQHSNVDCTSEDVAFIDDLGETIQANESLVDLCTADANKDMEKVDYNKIEVRQGMQELGFMDLLHLEPSLLVPSLEPAPNILHLEGRAVENPGVDIKSAVSHLAQPVCKPELAEVPTTTEGRGNRKRCGKHPTTLYECDCGEVISGGEVEEGEGLIECNKAGCEMRWVSPCLWCWKTGQYSPSMQ